MNISTSYHLLIIIPVFNDWECVKGILPRLDKTLSEYKDVDSTSVLIVDDASTLPPNIDFDTESAQCVKSIKILRHKLNLGHQRAIGIGLTYAQANLECDAVIVMDGDGEDRPEDIPTLLDGLAETNHEAIVFAERARRSESLVFVLFYHLYRLIHLILTGIAVRVGNFSAIPAQYLRNFSVISETWSHYAAVYTTSIPRTQIPIARGTRIAGQPTMHFTSLVTHGLSALAVHGAVIGVRMLIGFSGLLGLSALATVVFIFTDEELAWLAFFATAFFFICTLLTFGLNLLILNNRTQLGFLPGRDYEHFVGHVYDHDAE